MKKKYTFSWVKKFFHQLRLLLWKNFTIKRRSLFVFMFELTVPLVLFLIMFAIRLKQHSKPINTVYFDAWPLPSAGFIPLMQSFCRPENGFRNEHGFIEYPNSTAKEMLEQIDKILNSNWSTSWFQSSHISPKFKQEMPSNNLNFLSSQVMHVLLNNLTSDEESKPSSASDQQHPAFSANVNKTRLKSLLSQVPDSLFDELTSNETSIDYDELRVFVVSELASNPKSPTKVSKPERVTLMHRLFCDRARFTRIVHIRSPNRTDDHNAKLQPYLCSLSEEQLNSLDDLLYDPSVLSTDPAGNNERLIDSIQSRLDDFLNFQQALEDLSLLSIHFPTGLCGNKNAQTIISEGNAMKNKRPESFINENTTITNGDATLKKKLAKNYGFIGLWYSMQKTFCGAEPKATNTKRSTTTTASPFPTNTSDNEPDNDQFDNISNEQLKSLSLLFHVLYSNPVILYSPNTTLITDNLIRKTNATFQLIDRINVFFEQWLETSDELKKYLKHDRTNQSLSNLHSARMLAVQLNQSRTDEHTVGTSQDERVDFKLNKTTELNLNRTMLEENLAYLQSINFFDRLPNSTVSDLIDRVEMIDSAACSWLSLMSGVNLNLFKGFANEDDLVNYFLNMAYFDNVTVIASVVFNLKNDSADRLDPHISYKIRQNASFTYTTKKIRERYWYPSPRDWDYYYYIFGFVWLQDLIDRAIVDYHSNGTVLEPGAYLNQMPYPCYMIDNFLQMIQHVMPLCLSISFVYTVSMLTQTIVYEKELRLKEVMKIMGLNNSVHLFAWFITYFIQFSLIMFIVTCVLHFGRILTHSDPVLIFFLLEIYAVATICFSFLVSSLYSKAKLAAACAGILYFLSYVPCMYISIREDVAYEIIPWWAKTIASLLSTSAFGIGSKYIAFYENDGTGLQWKNIQKSPLENDTYNCFNCVCIMIVDCFLYLVLAWYIENVNPSYGIPLPWNYPFKVSYWLGGSNTHLPQSKMDDEPALMEPKKSVWLKFYEKLKRKSMISYTESDQARLIRNRLNHSLLRNNNEEDELNTTSASSTADNEYSHKARRQQQRGQTSRASTNYRMSLFEQEPADLPVGVSIRNLTKRYADSKLAVDNLSINFYENQITSFLGHNGAGKTTTISMLTGLIPATSGHALIYDKDIRTDINSIRNNLGLCPQHNILFDKLTVQEHLWFYAKLKQMNDDSIEELIENMLRDTGLKKKRNNMVNSLSGGMQRKLSVGIAFVGDANLVILDEPTAGVDPYARRAIWDMLLKYKEGRTIILSTHHMDEAELLGDRIAIISQGKLQCCGTSLFLKNVLGEGNNLTIVKDLESIERDVLKHEQEYKNDRDKFLAKFAPNSGLLESAGDDVSLNTELISSLVNKKCCDELVAFIRSFVPSVNLKDETLREYQFIIPLKERANKNYWDMFKALEENLNKLKISSFGIHDVSLEEIFIKAVQLDSKKPEPDQVSPPKTQIEQKEELPLVDNEQNDPDEQLIGNEDEDAEESSLNGSSSSSSSEESPSSNANDSLYNLDYIYEDLEKGYSRYLQQITAIVTKRYLYNKRNWKSLMTQIILPALFICVAMTVALSAPGFLDLPALELSTAQFYPLAMTKPDGIYVPYSYSTNASVDSTSHLGTNPASSVDIVNTLHLLVGIGSTCVLNRKNLTLNDLLFLNGSDASDIFNGRYFGNTDSCSVVLNQNADIDQQYFRMCQNGSSIRTKLKRHRVGEQSTVDSKTFFPSCTCLGDYSGFECKGTFDQPPTFKLITHETLLNITGQNETDYYLYTTDLYRLKRYGGLSFDNERHIKNEQSHHDTNQSVVFTNTNSIKKYELIQNLVKNRIARIWYNNKGFHAMPTFLNVMNNALLRANVKNRLSKETNTNDEVNLKVLQYGITTINHPMNQTNNYLSTEYLLQGSDVLISIFTIVAMSFVNASFVLFLVYERSNKSLHLQFLIGLNPFLYWITNFIWDMINYMLPASCVIIIFKIFDVPAYVHGSNYPAVILLFLFYGWSVSPLMYPLTFIFKEPSNAYIFLIVINLFTGITCVESSFLLQVFSLEKDEQDLKMVYDILKNVFLMFPPYCLGRGLIDIAYNDYYNSFYAKTGQLSKIRSPFEWDITTKNLVAMAGIGFISWIFTLLLEYEFFRFKWLTCLKRFTSRPLTNSTGSSPSRVGRQATFMREDLDVANERARVEHNIKSGVMQGESLVKNDRLVIQGLRKVYEKSRLFSWKQTWNRIRSFVSRSELKSNDFVAVKNLTFGVPEGECFGLLGVNGAGKTTTFKMLTTDLTPTSGSVFLMGPDGQYIEAFGNKKVYWNQIGYCPQFDALYDELTPVEHVKLFARLKGVRAKYEDTLCDSLLKRLDLTRYANKLTGALSLGNKRKLSTALALVGNPSFILLDEPTTGQDPVSRRRLWEEIINLTRQKNRSVLLTSHSMEECEALCTRLAIMVDGKFKCIGSVQHLKTKFGEGYTLTVKLKEMPKYISCASSNTLDDDTELESSTTSCSYVKSVLDSAARPSSNKYINQILKELKDKISINCRLKERHFNNVFQFELPCPNSNSPNYEPNTTGASCVSLNPDLNDFNIGDVYRLIELNKLKFNIADYSLSQNTLDNVFINFVKEQTNKKKQQQQQQKSSPIDDPQDYSSGDDSDNEHTGGNSSLQKSRKEVHFPIQDTDDLLIDFDDNLIDLDSRQLSLSDNHADSASELSKFEISNYSDSRSNPRPERVS